jgi:hypothetical protein
MITSTAVNSQSRTTPYEVFRSTTTGTSVGVEQTSAVTTIMLCNTGTPSATDETVNSVSVNIHLVKKGQTTKVSNLIVSNLSIPAGETVIFNEERIILDDGDLIYIGCSAGPIITTGSFVSGNNYTILNVGDTTFTSIGASANTSGVHFTATGIGGGTSGTAYQNLLSVTVSTLPV